MWEGKGEGRRRERGWGDGGESGGGREVEKTIWRQKHGE